MKNDPDHKPLKSKAVRKNITLAPEVREMLAKHAAENHTTESAIVARYIVERETERKRSESSGSMDHQTKRHA